MFQAKINLDIFENVILPKMLYTCLIKVYPRRSYCWNNGEKMIYIQAEPLLHLADSTNNHKATIIPLDSRKL